MPVALRVVGSSIGKVVSPDAREVSDEEIVNAENVLRNEAKKLIHEIDYKYWDLSRALYDVYDGIPSGYRGMKTGQGSKQERKSLFEKWGYKNFGDYCEQEVGIQKRTGENLRYAYYWFMIQQPMPEPVISDLISLGRSKVYLLSGVATRDSITLWIDKAKDLSYEELKKAIKMAKASVAAKNDDAEEVDSIGEFEAKREEEIVNSDSDSKPLPAPDSFTMVHYSLAPEQLETCNMAMERSKRLSNSDKVSHNFELICQDFLSNNSFSDVKEKDRSAYFSKMERRLGVLIIAVDPNSGKPVHGRDLLWRMMSEKNSDTEK